MKRTVKIMIALLAIAAMLLSFAACAEKKDGETTETQVETEADTTAEGETEADTTAEGETEADTTAEGETEAEDANAEGRALADFAGTYASGRCTVKIEAENETDALVTVTWGNTAAEVEEFTMHGSYNPDVFRLTYSDSEKKVVTYGENGEVVEEKVEYSNGVGRFQFNNDGTMRWEDEQEADALIDVVFEKVD